MLHLRAPATLSDCLAVLPGPCPQGVWAQIRAQIAAGPSVALDDAAGRVLAIGGFLPSARLREVWAVPTPALAPHLVAAARAFRLTLASFGHDDPRPLVAIARTRAGARLLRAAGFRDCGAGVYRWENEETGSCLMNDR